MAARSASGDSFFALIMAACSASAGPSRAFVEARDIARRVGSAPAPGAATVTTRVFLPRSRAADAGSLWRVRFAARVLDAALAGGAQRGRRQQGHAILRVRVALEDRAVV